MSQRKIDPANSLRENKNYKKKKTSIHQFHMVKTQTSELNYNTRTTADLALFIILSFLHLLPLLLHL